MNSRSFVVRLEGGRTLRRNCHQLQLRPGPIQFQEEEDGLEEPKVEDNEPEKQENQATTSRTAGHQTFGTVYKKASEENEDVGFGFVLGVSVRKYIRDWYEIYGTCISP